MWLTRTLREVSQGVALIAHEPRLSQLLRYYSESKELQRFKAKLDTALLAFMVGTLFGSSASPF